MVELKLKVAMVSPNPPWFPGGVERHVGELAKGMKKDIDMEIYCTSLDKTEVGTKKWEGMTTKVFKATGSGYHYSKQLSSYLKNELECDIIHAHGFTTHMPYAASKNKNRRSFIFTPHFHPVGSKAVYQLGRKMYDPLIGTKILNKTDRIICVSKTEKEMLSNKFPGIEDRITIIPSGVDIGSIKDAEPYKIEGPMILYVGRMEKYKNVDLIIRAAKDLPDDFQIYLIGSGPEQKRLKNLTVELKLDGRVHFLGYVDDTELHRWRRTCDVFLNLSDIEAFGSSVIEALAANKPVIVNDMMSLKEFAEKFPEAVSAIDIHNKDVSELTGLIQKQIKRSKEVRSLKINVDDYEWSNVCAATMKLYQNSLE